MNGKSDSLPVDSEVFEELDRALAKFPTWPTDPLHALAVLGEEFGELTKAMLQFTYEPHKTTRLEIRKEAIQTAAMALRLVRSLSVYDYARSAQHSQEAPVPRNHCHWSGCQCSAPEGKMYCGRHSNMEPKR